MSVQFKFEFDGETLTIPESPTSHILKQRYETKVKAIFLHIKNLDFTEKLNTITLNCNQTKIPLEYKVISFEINDELINDELNDHLLEIFNKT